MHKNCLLTVVIVFLFMQASLTGAHPTRKALRVAFLDRVPPISYLDQDHQPKGLAIDIWKEIALQNHWKYTFFPITLHTDTAIGKIQKKEYDVLVGPVSVSHKRMRIVDFTHPFFLNKIGLVVPDTEWSFWETITRLFGKMMLYMLGLTFMAFLIFSHLFWYFERGKSEEVSTDYIRGIGSAMWTTLASFLRDVLYDPKVVSARLVLSFWLLCSVIFMATIAALITSSLTLTLTLEHRIYHKPSDLINEKVAVIAKSINVSIAKQIGAKVVSVDDIPTAIKYLETGKVRAFIDDYYIMQYYLSRHHDLKLHMSNLILANDAYSFVLPKKSSLTDDISLTLTRLQDNGYTSLVCRNYLTENVHACDF